MPAIIKKEEIYVRRALITELGGFTTSDFTDFMRRNNIQTNEEKRYPVFAIMAALNDERKARRFGSAGKEALTDLEREKKTEEVRKLRIVNDEREGLLIGRSEAKDRVRTVFRAVANKIRYSIKRCAPKVMGMDSARLIEEILTKDYNTAIKSLESEAKNISWETDGLKNYA